MIERNQAVYDRLYEWLNERLAASYILASGKATHTNTCSTSVAPARQPGPCDCDAEDVQ